MPTAILRRTLRFCERIARDLGDTLDRRWADDEPGAFFGPRCG